MRRIHEFFSFVDIKESLSHSFVHYNQSYVRISRLAWFNSVFVMNDFLELLQLVINDLFSHWVTNTISVDKNMVRHLAFVKVSVGLERSLEVILKDCWWDNLLAFLSLRTGLSIVLAKMWVISGNKPNYTLLSFVAYIYSNKHSFLWDFITKAHSPEISS